MINECICCEVITTIRWVYTPTALKNDCKYIDPAQKGVNEKSDKTIFNIKPNNVMTF